MLRTGVLVVLVVSGCGDDLCKRSAAISEDCGQEVTQEDIDECRELLAGCSNEDQKLMSDSLDCLEDAGLATCAEGEELNFTEGDEDLEALFACVLPLAGVSASCQEFYALTTSTTTSEPN